MFNKLMHSTILIAFCVACSLSVQAAENKPKTPTTKNPPAAKKTANLQVPDGYVSKLFADQTLINNPLSIAIDTKNRVYVCESNRFLRGVVDSRRVNEWFLDEIACYSLEDRQKLYDKYIEKGTFSKTYFTETADIITTLIDTDNDGVADKSAVYAGDFNHALDGNGSSVLLGSEGVMYYANIPHIWKLTDTNDDGISDKREKFISGIGFRSGVNGHDLHGLEWGVDGRLYFSNGDRGYGITTKEGKKLYSAERGAIFRCEPDGSNLEEFCIGNRNPQDLGFDQYGNLFTVDNNRGSGDQSRVCYLVELGDYAWNSGHENKRTFFGAVKLNQRSGPSPTDQWTKLGPWRTKFPEQPAYCIPSMEYIGGGSVGITFNPGDSMGPDYKNHFFYCAYSQGINTFRFIPDGGGLKIDNLNTFCKGGLFTDTEFSADGKLYIADYVTTPNAPEGEKKGLIYVVESKEYANVSSVKDAHKKLTAGFDKVSNDELFKNLYHEDMRVRLFSQYALAHKGAAGITQFKAAIDQQTHELARLHGIWGIGQCARQTGEASGLSHLTTILKDKNWQIRAQAVKVLGESGDEKYFSAVLPTLTDENARVRFFAYTAIGKLAPVADTTARDALLKQLQTINDQDVFLRHSAIAGLIYLAQRQASTPAFLAQQSQHASAAVRRAALLVLARCGDEQVLSFLNDKDPTIVQETILAIDRMNNHALIEKCYTTLERFTNGTPTIEDAYQERLLQWCFRIGNEQATQLVAQYARNNDVSEHLRRIALHDLNRWVIKPPVDPVIGQIRPVNDKRFDAETVLKETLTSLLKSKMSPGFEADTLVMAMALKLPLDEQAIANKITSSDIPNEARINFFEKLADSGYPRIKDFIDKLLQDKQVALRAAAYKALARTDKDGFKKKIETDHDKDSQAIYLALIKMKKHKFEDFLKKQLESLKDGKHPKESIVELLEAAKATNNKDLKKIAIDYEKDLEKSKDPLAKFQGALYGGDAVEGRKLVIEQSVGQCIICHKFEGKGGIVAPDLSQIAMEKRATREYFLESLINPSAQIVPGYGNMTVTLKNGETVIGSLLEEDKKMLQLKFVDGSKKEIAIADIKNRTPAMSVMPPMGATLKFDQIRDIIAYLASLNKPVQAAKDDH